MIHIRTDDWLPNDRRTFRCGIGPALPPGDRWFHESEACADRLADCPGCNPSPRKLGVPIDQLSGRAEPGNPAWAWFKALARSWGYD